MSLKTGSLAEAKPKWAALFSEFEVALAKARSPKVERIVEPPTPEVIDEAVRGWWRDHLHAQATNDFGRDNPEIHDRIEDDSRYEGQLLQTMRPGSNRRPPELQTEWIAEHLIATNEWRIDRTSRLYSHLLSRVCEPQE